MIELTKEEEYIVEQWRELGDWGVLEVEKAGGKLFEVRRHTTSRPVVEKK